MLSLIGQNWTHFLWALIATIMMVIIGFLTPLLLSEIVDSILGSEPFTMPDFLMNPINDLGGRDFLRQNLWIPALALILMNVVNGVFTFIKGRSSAIASENIARKLRNDLYRHLQHLPFAYHVKAQAGELIQRCTSDVDTIRRFLAVQVMEVVNTVLMVVIAMSILLPRSVPITLYSLILVPPLFCFATWFFKMVHKSFEVADEADGVLNAVLQENLSGVRVVRAFGQQEREVEKFDRVNNDLRKKNLRLNELLAIYWGGGDAISMTQTLLTLVVCIIYACNGWITVGTLIVFTSTLGMLLFPIRQLGRTLSDAGKAMVSMKRVQAILHEEAEPDEPNALKPDLHGDIVFDHVSFAYPDDNVPVLRDVSFTIPAGKTAAVRSLLFIGKLKDSPTTRVLIHEKSSLAPPGQSIAFSLGDEKGFAWIGAYDITADELLAGTDTAKTESKTAQAQMLILELLADGKRMPSAELEKAVNERGISSRTMRTAKSRIGDRLVTEKDGTAWVCYLRN